MTMLPVIAPTDLRDFLKAHGWRLNEAALPDRLYALENDNFARRQLVFPMDINAPDYEESTASALSKFASLAGMPEATARARIQEMRDDVLRLRVYFAGNDIALPLSFTSVFIQSTEQMFKAAACSVLRPRIHHPRLALTEAVRFIENARFGQTEIGSFVMHVACPIHSMEDQGNLLAEIDGAPFVRQVTASLRNGLQKLAGAIEADTLDRFVEQLKISEAPEVSSNLCEALSDMHDQQIDNSLDLQFDWSILSDALRPASTLPIRFPRDYFYRIEEVRRELRAVEFNDVGTFIGTVERLDGELGADGRRSGEVVLSLWLPDEGGTIRARTVLSSVDYASADRAHMASSAYVSVTGRLRPGRQPRQLTDLTSFRLLAD